MQKPHARIPFSWTKTEGAELSGEAFKLYHIMLCFAKPPDGVCWPSQKTLSKHMQNASKTKIYRLQLELEAAKLIEIKVHGRGRVNSYFVHIPK